MSDPRDDHWLVRPTTIRWLRRGSLSVLALIVAAQLGVDIKGYFGVDGWFGFGAAFGFAACVLLVLIAKALGYVLKRDEGYYDD